MGKYYAVEKIIGKKIEDNEIHYLIKWEGYPKDQSTWEPLENLTHALDLVNEYEILNIKNNPNPSKNLTKYDSSGLETTKEDKSTVNVLSKKKRFRSSSRSDSEKKDKISKN